jgi:ADP-dependent NAD(P)H-hydrate dehydratase / NAD(P)H-hydrate epimerase
MRLVTAEEMRRLDRATIEGGHATGFDLMARAGAGVVTAIERAYGPVLAWRALVLCGTGNNGGDGFVAARGLRARGVDVQVAILGERAKVRGDARAHLERLEAEGAAVREARDEAALAAIVGARDRWDFALDALLGTGARGAPEGMIAAGVQALRELDETGTRVVALDLPTGVDADSGAIARRAVRAALTVTFGAAKRGHWLYPGRAFTGPLAIVDIGLLDRWGDDDTEARRVEVSSDAEIAERLPFRAPQAHKTSVGRVLVVAGSPGLTGAAALTASAATRAGAGYVTLAVPRGVAGVLAIKLTGEMTRGVDETPAGTLGAGARATILELCARNDAVAIGPGCSRDPETAELLRALVREARVPMVVDADALGAFEGHATELRDAAAPRVLTPHLGEMARLTGASADELERRRIDAARERAEAWGVTVLLKGAPTVIARPDGHATVNATGNPALATAGTGDVLTGTIAAFVAQGLAPYEAARAAAHVHGAAGDRIATARGPIGTRATDVVEELPHAIHALARIREESLEKRGVRARGTP